MHIHYHLIDEGFMHADQVFFGQAVILILYYVVFGVFISLRYGSGLTDLKFTVYGYPPIVVIAIGILFFVMELSMLKHDLNDYHTFERIIVSTVFFRVKIHIFRPTIDENIIFLIIEIESSKFYKN